MTLLSLQKTLALLVMPVGLLWLLLLGACLLCFRRRQRAPALLLLGITVLYAAAGNIHLGAALMARLEATVPAVELATVPPFDAVCVLGGGSGEDGLGRPQLNLSGDRIFLAARLWHGGKAKVLVASGFTRDSLRGIRNGGEESRALWRSLGIPDSAILVVTEPCWITRDEIAAYRKLQVRFGWQRLALVSSAAHLPRALVLAGKAGLAVTPLGSDWRGRPHTFQLHYLIPQAEGFLDVHRASWEYLGRWVGR